MLIIYIHHNYNTYKICIVFWWLKCKTIVINVFIHRKLYVYLHLLTINNFVYDVCDVCDVCLSNKFMHV